VAPGKIASVTVAWSKETNNLALISKEHSVIGETHQKPLSYHRSKAQVSQPQRRRQTDLMKLRLSCVDGSQKEGRHVRVRGVMSAVEQEENERWWAKTRKSTLCNAHKYLFDAVT